MPAPPQIRSQQEGSQGFWPLISVPRVGCPACIPPEGAEPPPACEISQWDTCPWHPASPCAYTLSASFPEFLLFRDPFTSLGAPWARSLENDWQFKAAALPGTLGTWGRCQVKNFHLFPPSFLLPSPLPSHLLPPPTPTPNQYWSLALCYVLGLQNQRHKTWL